MKTEPKSLERRLASWCPDCKLFFDGYSGPKAQCLEGGCERILLKRRLWVCSVCESGYRLLSHADDHACLERSQCVWE